MRFSPPLPIAAATAWLPRHRQPLPAADGGPTAASPGRRPQQVAVSRRLAAPELAVRAAREALRRARWGAGSVNFVAHAWTHHQGHDFWSPAHYVARHAGASGAVAVGVQQMCNGGGMAMGLAAAQLVADPSVRRALVTTGDAFVPPGFDRLRGDYGVVYGDGGTAVLLGGSAGPAELVALATVSSAELEEMYRGRRPFSPAARWHAGPVDVRAAKREYLREHGAEVAAALVREHVAEVVARALAEAGLRPGSPSLAWLGLPRLRADVLDCYYLPALAGLTHARRLALGERTGHLGAGDLPADLAHLLNRRALRPGSYALLLSAGGGAAWTCAVVRGCAGRWTR